MFPFGKKDPCMSKIKISFLAVIAQITMVAGVQPLSRSAHSRIQSLGVSGAWLQFLLHTLEALMRALQGM